MKTLRSFIRLSAVLSFAFVISTPSAGSSDLAETLGQAAARTPATPSLSDATRDAGDYYTYQGGQIFLSRSLDVVGVRFAEGVTPEQAGAIVRNADAAASVELAGRAPTRGVSLVRVARPAGGGPVDVPGADRTGPVLESLRASAEVLYAFPVLVNPATGNRLLLTDEVVARLRPGVTTTAVTAAHGLVEVERLWGTLDEHVFRLIDPKSQDPLETANRLAASDLVLWAEPNFVQQYDLEATPNDPSYPGQWHLNNTGQGGGTPDADVDAPEAWDTTTGSSAITIAIIDDGVERTHEDLSARIFVNSGEVAGDGIDNDGNGYVDDVRGWDFSNNDNDPSPMDADDNHGTAVAGVAAATGNNGLGVSGACQSCRILPIKVFSPDFVGSTAAANAIRYAASLADVLNNSWGGGTPSAAIQSAIQWAIANGRGGKGSSVFFASGNSAGAWIQFSLGGIPAGTHKFRWRYVKNGSVSSGEDTVWLGWVQFPGGERVNFESGSLPAGFSTGGNASWSVASNPARADEGLCLTKSAKAGAITHSQTTYLDAVKTVPAGTLVYRAWVSSEYTSSSVYDVFEILFSLNNTGTFSGPYLRFAGVPDVETAVGYPAAHPESIAVGAVTDFDCRSGYSQYGPELDVVAPSNGGASGITTTDRTGSAGYNTSGSYYTGFGGTSSATPLTSGVAGLVLSAAAGLTAAQVRSTLQDTAEKVGPYPYVAGRNDRYGYGRVNAQAAVSGGGATINPTSAAFGAGGGPGTVTVTASAGYAWTAVSNDAWITITSGASGTGSGTVQYLVAANPGFSRTGTMTIAGRTFTVNQASSCTASISPTSASFPAAGGTGQVTVTVTGGCSWTAVSKDGWITVTSGASGTGNGVVGYSVAPNMGVARTGSIVIAGLSFTVSQASEGTWMGTWQGTTSQSLPLSFQVSGQQVTTLSVKLRVQMGYGMPICDYTFQSNSPATISGSSFQISVYADGSLLSSNTTVVRGNFTSPTSATGTVDSFQVSYMVCGGVTFGTPYTQASRTWTATRTVPKADLAVVKTDGKTSVVAGAANAYTITVTNNGPEPVTSLTLTDTRPATLLNPVFTPSSGAYDPATGAWTGLSLSSGQSVVLTLSATVSPSATGTLTNTATVSPPAGFSDPTTGNNSSTDTDSITVQADVGITKTGPGLVTAPSGLTYRIVVTNGGPSDASSVVVSDATPDGLSFLFNTGACTSAFPCSLGTVPAGQSRTIDATFNVPADYDGPATISNTASVSTTTPDPNGANDTSTVTTQVCTASISPTSASFPAAGGTGQVTVTVTAGCSWTAVSNDAWITVTGGSSGTGSGTVNYSVAANTGSERSGTMTIAGLTFTVDQASGCTYAIDPTSASYGLGGGTGDVSVATAAGCAWTATSNDGWITVTGGSSGTGDGSVSYSVAATTGDARTGTMTIAGHAFTVSQGDERGFYTVTPCRAFDSRQPAHGPALQAGETRAITVGGVCEVPADASAVSYNVTAVSPGGPGHLRIFPAGASRPNISTINYVAGQTRANNGIVVLGDAGQLAVYVGQASGSVHVVIDVNGYFVEE